MIIPICIFLALLAAPTLEQDSGSTPISPCPNVFSYEPPGSEPGRWYGEVNLSTDSTLHSLWLNIVLDNKAELLGNWVGKVSTKDSLNFKIENSTMEINPGSAVPVRFFVQYNPLNRTPKLMGIRLNGREICNTPSEIPLSIEPVAEPDPWISPAKEQLPTTDSPGKEAQCGTVVTNPIPLVVYGTSTYERQWPWQIALYQTQTESIKFICGGTLVTHKHIITAAHCVAGERALRHPSTLIVFLGKHNRRITGEGEQIQIVKEVIVNPNYNSSSYKHDVAILKLREPVTYSDYVRPACLWPDNKVDLKNVVGKKGSVVGWGLNEAGVATEELSLVEMPVVSQETCIKSFSSFFTKYTSDYTYCAGSRDASSVCNGDSGGGMVFRMDGIWYLRGLVSLSVPKNADPGKPPLRCDTTHYVIFTDLAKFLPWINDTVSDF